MHAVTNIPKTLRPDIGELALGAFHFVWCTQDSTLYTDTALATRGNGCLESAVKLLGLDTIEQAHDIWYGSALLQRLYIKAIQKLNAALVSPSESKQDSTLLACLIMGMIETKVSPQQSLDHWMYHATGAAKILVLRGSEQVKTDAGALLYMQASGSLFTSCLISRTPIPQRFRDIRTAVSRHAISTSHPLWRFHGVMLRFVDFWSSVPIDLEWCATMTYNFIKDAVSIHEEFVSIFNDASPMWQCNTIRQDHSPVGYIQGYQNATASQVWHGSRCAIIALFDAILRAYSSCKQKQLLHLDTRLLQYVSGAAQMINQAALDLVASTPQTKEQIFARLSRYSVKRSTEALPLVDEGFVASPTPFRPRGDQGLSLPTLAIGSSGGLLLHFALYFAATFGTVDDSVRQLLLAALDDYAISLNVRQAELFADELRARRAGSLRPGRSTNE